MSLQSVRSSKKLSRADLTKKDTVSAKQILYSDFQKTILDFQLREHERFLQKFNQAFKAIDTNSDGVLSEDQFSQLIWSMNILQT